MSSWLSRALVVLVAFGLCWLGAIAWWRETRHMPGTGDVVIFFVVLPLLLLLAFWVGRKLVAASGARAAAAAAAAAAGATAGTAGAATTAPPQAVPLNALAAALRMPHGDSAAQLSAALRSRKANLALDPELTNASGYPILSGRIDDVDPLAQQDEMRAWLAARHPQADFNDEQWRALALGSAVAAELAIELGPHPALPAYLDALQARRPVPPLPVLHLVTLLPDDWREEERLAGTDWLRHLAGKAWPQERISLAHPGSAGAAVADVAQRAAQARVDAQPFLCLVLACGSRIGQDSVDAWSLELMLFDSDHPNGRVPGEGAAGLLLADLAQGALFDVDQPVLLYPPASARRVASIDDKPRAEAVLLSQLAAQALAAAPGVDVAVVTADADARVARNSELLGAVHAALPDLDPAGQVLALGPACGDAGAVTTLAALALAHHEVAAGSGAALCLTNLDPFHRSAVLLAPQVAATSTASTPTPT